MKSISNDDPWRHLKRTLRFAHLYNAGPQRIASLLERAYGGPVQPQATQTPPFARSAVYEAVDACLRGDHA